MVDDLCPNVYSHIVWNVSMRQASSDGDKCGRHGSTITWRNLLPWEKSDLVQFLWDLSKMTLN
jgi:hypothetical protein